MECSLPQNARLRPGGVHHRRGEGAVGDRPAVDGQRHVTRKSGECGGEVARISTLYDKVNAILAKQSALEKQLQEEKKTE